MVEIEIQFNPPKVIATNKTLETCPEVSISKIVTQLYRLVDWSVAIAEICALWSTEVDVEALS